MTMQSIIDKYRIDAVWHFTDKSNIDSIKANGGLYSLRNLRESRIDVLSPGGNQWSHDADIYKGVDGYVHLAFLTEHPMLYVAKVEGRIKNPVWLKICPSVLLDVNIRFTNDVSNKRGVQLFNVEQAVEVIDFDVLFNYMDWKNPEIQARRRMALKSEILIPQHISLNKLLGVYNG